MTFSPCSYRAVHFASIWIAAFLMLTSMADKVVAQRSNDSLQQQIRLLKAEKGIKLTFDAAANTSKIMATAEQFPDAEAARAGIQAMSFGMAFFYPGSSLATPPDTVNLTFWVLTKKPRFESGNRWTASLTGEKLDLGDARYAVKQAENMEYLNFKLPLETLEKIGRSQAATFTLGDKAFEFTTGQLDLIRKFVVIAKGQ